MSAEVPNYAANLMITNFLLASLVLGPRPFKAYLTIDRNIAPREDLNKYGNSDVEKGKISPATLAILKRLESSHANGMEHLPFFIGSMLFALHASLSNVTINSAGIAYTISRILYTLTYAFGATLRASYLRSLLWYASTFVCVILLSQSGKAINR